MPWRPPSCHAGPKGCPPADPPSKPAHCTHQRTACVTLSPARSLSLVSAPQEEDAQRDLQGRHAKPPSVSPRCLCCQLNGLGLACPGISPLALLVRAREAQAIQLAAKTPWTHARGLCVSTLQVTLRILLLRSADEGKRARWRERDTCSPLVRAVGGLARGIGRRTPLGPCVARGRPPWHLESLPTHCLGY